MGFPDLSKSPIIKTSEADMDSLFVEELHSSKDFQSWILKKFALGDSYEFNNAWRSVHGNIHGKDRV